MAEEGTASALGRGADALRLPRVIGHRGAAAHAPENTLAGIACAADQGALWVEFDVKLTRDRVPVLLHDDDLRRVAGLDAKVAGLDWETLRHVDVSRGFDVEASVPMLDDALALLGRLGLGANVEIKPCPGRERETAEVVVDRLLRLRGPSAPPLLVSSFALPCLEVALSRAPDLPRGLLAGRLPLRWRALMRRFRCTTIHLDHRRVGPRQFAAIRREGVPLLLYTVNDPARARDLIGAGAAALFSDAPGRVTEALKDRPHDAS